MFFLTLGAQRSEAAPVGPGPGTRVAAQATRTDTLSSMIPPPPKTSERVVSDASDDDWN